MQAALTQRSPMSSSARRGSSGAAAASRPARRLAVRVAASTARVANKDLLEVAQAAAAAGAKVRGGLQGHCCSAGCRSTALSLPLDALLRRRKLHPPCNGSPSTPGQVVLEAVDKPRAGVQTKGSSADLVTATDLASEQAVLSIIQAAFPGHAVLGEEGGVSGALPQEHGGAGRRAARRRGGGGAAQWGAVCRRAGRPAAGAAPEDGTPLHPPPCNHYMAYLTSQPAGDTNSEYLWCVDPLDGTTNFAHGYPSFAVSVACLRHTTPVAATGAHARM